jgi:hypothetical protein
LTLNELLKETGCKVVMEQVWLWQAFTGYHFRVVIYCLKKDNAKKNLLHEEVAVRRKIE